MTSNVQLGLANRSVSTHFDEICRRVFYEFSRLFQLLLDCQAPSLAQIDLKKLNSSAYIPGQGAGGKHENHSEADSNCSRFRLTNPSSRFINGISTY